MDDLNGRVALVTGGSRGIGRAIALGLARAGCKVAVGYHSGREEAEAVVRGIAGAGGTAVALGADLGDPAEAARLAARVAEALGPVEILVNNAGVASPRPVGEITAAEWDETIRVNLSSVFHVTQGALPAMRGRGWGRIIILSSVAAQLGGVIGPHYAASKAGLLGLMHGYASQLVKEGITANAIAPALVETDMIAGNPAITPDRIPVGRFGRPDEIADVAVMLAGNGYVTGQTINVNGGWYMS
ncbi:MAG: SDR family NAD(P)-dependent oxidoreductase [Novosphingobium sp.]|jgi:3-oxoacyl-[acyl-carrier protein] reductase